MDRIGPGAHPDELLRRVMTTHPAAVDADTGMASGGRPRSGPRAQIRIRRRAIARACTQKEDDAMTAVASPRTRIWSSRPSKCGTVVQGRTHGPRSTQFESAIIPLLGPLYRQALRMTSNQADAEDLVQETMLNAYVGLSAFEPGTNLKAWLRRIMINTYIDSYRRQKRRPAQYPTDEITDRQLAASAPRTSGALRSAEDQALEMLPDPYLKAAMMVLPEQFRMAVYFADIAGYSYKEIAAMTDTRQGTVSSRINRGRKQLRDLLVDSPVDHAARPIDEAPSGATQKRASVNGDE